MKKWARFFHLLLLPPDPTSGTQRPRKKTHSNRALQVVQERRRIFEKKNKDVGKESSTVIITYFYITTGWKRRVDRSSRAAVDQWWMMNLEERGIENCVAQVEVEVTASVAGAVISAGFDSSTTGGSSTGLSEGDVVFGRLAVDKVGELVD